MREGLQNVGWVRRKLCQGGCRSLQTLQVPSDVDETAVCDSPRGGLKNVGEVQGTLIEGLCEKDETGGDDAADFNEGLTEVPKQTPCDVSVDDFVRAWRDLLFEVVGNEKIVKICLVREFTREGGSQSHLNDVRSRAVAKVFSDTPTDKAIVAGFIG